tara:strand:- start:1 stop:474 length:474 start_codon:yes stop_codon:yes gene_type:complete
MTKVKKSYKEIHGTSRVGDFLRSINKNDLLGKVIGAGVGIATGNVGGAIKSLLKGSDELTEEQRIYALKLLESDVKEQEEISNRWKYDMQSDSRLAKNIRPLVIAYLTIVVSLLAFLDSAFPQFTVKAQWITLFTTLLATVYVAYFGGRSYEKTKKL